MALDEDMAFDDITSDLTITNNNSLVNFQINSRQDMIFCGKDVAFEVINQLKNADKFANQNIEINFHKQDGELVKKSQNIATGTANIKMILAGERVILNLIQHLSSIATSTHKFVEALDNKKIKILDTRKTLPIYRYLQKYAVRCGGGFNHRMNLRDQILIKDNHISAGGGVDNVLNKAINQNLKVEIECDNIQQVEQSLPYAPDIIMLDNMSIIEVQKAINLIRQKLPNTLIEVSGGVDLSNIGNYRQLDIDFISVGSLTNSLQNVDIGLDFI